jgi:hypothetical protein
MADGDYTNTYWCKKGKYQALFVILDKLIPAGGKCEKPRSENLWLERLRLVQNAYHDVYNNGGGNRDSSIKHWFGMERWESWHTSQANIDHMEEVFDGIVLKAFEEQVALGNISMKTKKDTPKRVQMEMAI